MKLLLENWRKYLNESVEDLVLYIADAVEQQVPPAEMAASLSQRGASFEELAEAFATLISSTTSDREVAIEPDEPEPAVEPEDITEAEQLELPGLEQPRGRIMDEIRGLVQEVYSEKQRRWACAQAGKKKRKASLSKKEAEEMCKGPMKEHEEERDPDIDWDYPSWEGFPPYDFDTERSKHFATVSPHERFVIAANPQFKEFLRDQGIELSHQAIKDYLIGIGLEPDVAGDYALGALEAPGAQ